MIDDDTELTTQPLPALLIRSVDAWGVSADGSESVINVTTATQQIQLHTAFQVLSDLSRNAQAALSKAKSNAAEKGEDLAAATPVNKFMVGRAAGAKGVLMVLNAETAFEAIFMVPAMGAISLGKLLMAEGTRQRRLDAAVAGRNEIVKPGPRKLIIPGRQN